MNIVEEMISKGIKISNHESDLYCENTLEAQEIVKRHGYTFSCFINQAPPNKGKSWLDVPFAYIPWWEAKARRTM